VTQQIHPTATVDPSAELADDVSVGPGCVLAAGVSIQGGTKLLPGTIIDGHCRIGRDCVIGPHATLATPPQHRGYDGGVTYLTLGDRCVIREFASLHRGFVPGGRGTVLGDDCYLMATAHVGHDAVIGDRVTLANATLIGGHVSIGDDAFFGGMAGIHQNCRVGRLAMIGGAEILRKDVPPFALIQGGGLRAYNHVGLRRAEFAADIRSALQRAFQHLRSKPPCDLLTSPVAEVRELADFYTTTTRGVVGHART
jgi:UDP-N-acetylglucosamine acyltransferase